MEANKSLRFQVVRKRPELITPARQTVHEVKLLSDIDSQTTHHFQISGLSFYPAVASVEGKDPVKVICDAIGKALVFYYPLAGRLRETASYKLAVECTGEGIIFIEADADVTLQHFRDSLLPPIPCFLAPTKSFILQYC